MRRRDFINTARRRGCMVAARVARAAARARTSCRDAFSNPPLPQPNPPYTSRLLGIHQHEHDPTWLLAAIDPGVIGRLLND